MGQKVNPISIRLGINRTWNFNWFAEGDRYADLLHQDLAIRSYLRKTFKQQGAISRIIIERPHSKCSVTIHTARPGVVIGKKGADIEKIRRKITEMTKVETHINIIEVRKPETDARLIAEGIAQQLERRAPFRRAMKRALQLAMRLGVEGVRINCAGRLGGVEIARTEWYHEGRVPLHTLRANIDYAKVDSHTTYGVCGIKVWVYKGEIMEHNPNARDNIQKESADRAPVATEGAS